MMVAMMMAMMMTMMAFSKGHSDHRADGKSNAHSGSWVMLLRLVLSYDYHLSGGFISVGGLLLTYNHCCLGWRLLILVLGLGLVLIRLLVGRLLLILGTWLRILLGRLLVVRRLLVALRRRLLVTLCRRRLVALSRWLVLIIGLLLLSDRVAMLVLRLVLRGTQIGILVVLWGLYLLVWFEVGNVLNQHSSWWALFYIFNEFTYFWMKTSGSLTTLNAMKSKNCS